MGNNELTVRLENVNFRTKEELTQIIRSVKALELVESTVPCNLLIFEVGRDVERDFLRLSEIKASGEAGEIFLTALQADSNLLMRALRAGVKEFFPQPLRKDDVTEALLKFVQKEREGEDVKTTKGKVITVFGAKGGVGTTTMAVNLAAGMVHFKDHPSVALVDMNLFSGDVSLFLNMKSSFNWAEVARNISRLDTTYLMTILRQHESGIYVLSAPVMIKEEAGMTPEFTARVERVLELMRSLFDFVIIDGGLLLGQISTYFIGISDKVLLVTIPTIQGIINLKKLIDIFYDLGYPAANTIAVMNRCNQRYGVSLEEVRKMIKKDIRWNIPNDFRETINAINTGVPLTKSAVNSDITKKILEMAAEYSSAEPVKEKEKKSFFSRF